MVSSDHQLQDWRDRALRLEQEVSKVIIGQATAVRLCNIAVFSRGHVLLEGDVGVGKTTLLRAFAAAIGGAYERIEGTIDLLPHDLLYYTFIGDDGKPRVDVGPLLKHGENLATFFFNEINRARPQVHSLLLRVMAERSVNAFNREYRIPHLQVFADRNRIEKEETFELPSAARDRFFMEIPVPMPVDTEVQRALMFDSRFHDPDALLGEVTPGLLDHTALNEVAAAVQRGVHASDTLVQYALDLCRATRAPLEFGITLQDVDMQQLVQAGVSPRGMSMMLRAARVVAWLAGRDNLIPEDLHAVFTPTVAHRVFFKPVYELRRGDIAPVFMRKILAQVTAP